MKNYSIRMNEGNVYSICVSYSEQGYCRVSIFCEVGSTKTYCTECKCVARLACCGPDSVSYERALEIVRGGLTRGQKANLTRMMKG